MEPAVKTWLARQARAFLRRVGLKEGQTVLDFGCNKGNYTIPASEIVGPHGKLYALDKERDILSDLQRNLQKRGIHNVACIEVSENDEIPLPAGSVDVVLLYDVLHRGYFPQCHERKRNLMKVHRILKPGGLLSFYPTHLKQYGMTLAKAIDEVTSVGFELKGRAYRRLVHDDRLVRGNIFSFTRKIQANKLR